MNESSKHGTDFVRDLGDAVRKNPISAALIGMGVVWLFAGRTRLSNPIERVANVADSAQDVWRGAASNLKAGSEKVHGGVSAASTALRDHGANFANGVLEKGGEFAESISEYAGSFPDVAENIFDNVQANLTELFRSQPLALGAVGLAMGAAIAASIPVTDGETEYLGETSDFVKQKVGEIASEKARDATDLGEKVVSAMADEASKQGLTMEGVESTAHQLSEKVSSVAEVIKTSPRTKGKGKDSDGRAAPSPTPGEIT
jgi:hypothetical protein